MQTIFQWFRLNTRIPSWTPAHWRHPLTGYLLVGPLVGAALLIDLGLLSILPAFAFIDLPVTFMILIVALIWGAGPALLSTLLGTFLLYYIFYPPHFALRWKDLVDMVEGCGVIIGGLLITLYVSHHDAQRRILVQRAQEETELRQKMDAFLALTSHELNTPLTLIQLQLQITQRHLTQAQATEETTVESLKQVLKQTSEQIAATLEHWTRLNRLVSDLLELARFQMDEVLCYLQGVDLRSVLEARVHQQRQITPYAAIELLLPPGDTELRVVADAQRLEQVLGNYLANAIKYSPDGTPVTVGAEVKDGHVLVRVRDKGPGLPAQEQDRIWERFYRSPGIAVQRGSTVGLGIGLFLCRQIIEDHHGTVGVDSAPGEGATFWFTLPLAQEALSRLDHP